MADFTVKFSSTGGTFTVEMLGSAEEFNAAFGDLQTVTIQEFDMYEGAYEVTPQIEAQTIPTAQKTMKEDMVIKEIPYAEVSNIFGGKTVTIGG